MARRKIISGVKGMRDILPAQQPLWDKMRKGAEETAAAFGFWRLDTPILEEQDLFARGIGLGTDIVEKEMFTLTTRGRDKLALRPEFTAGVVRAFIQHGLFSLAQPLKLWSLGPLFRYEQPQAGRFRQLRQFNLEVFGAADAILDAQIIQAGFWFFKKIGLKNIILHLNSLGCAKCRKEYRRALLAYYRPHKNKLCADCKKRSRQNPLRLLDCKKEQCQELAQKAPLLVDHVCDDCKDHFKQVLDYLDGLEISYYLDNTLVRGLDYYNKTVFEFFAADEKEGKKNALGGGGRYDGLVKLLGGKDTPAVGMAVGLERVAEEIKKQGVKINGQNQPTVFLIQLGKMAKKRSLLLFEELLRARLAVAESFSRDSIKSQLKLADKQGAKIALILGQQEALDDSVIIRVMETGVQEIVPLVKVIKELKKKLQKLK